MFSSAQWVSQWCRWTRSKITQQHSTKWSRTSFIYRISRRALPWTRPARWPSETNVAGCNLTPDGSSERTSRVERVKKRSFGDTCAPCVRLLWVRTVFMSTAATILTSYPRPQLSAQHGLRAREQPEWRKPPVSPSLWVSLHLEGFLGDPVTAVDVSRDANRSWI